MMESIEKLRGTVEVYAAQCDVGWMLDGLEEIEAEIAERYMLLPVDADGVPIRVGDTVKSIKIDNYVTTVAEHRPISSNGGWMKPEFYVHVKPRTIEDVLRDLVDGIGSVEFDALTAIGEAADEIRELMEVDR